MSRRLVVTGTRNGRPDVHAALDAWVEAFGIPDEFHVGDAPGVDAQAWIWAIARHGAMTRWKHHADWSRFGKRAGPERNARMVKAAGGRSHCLAFPGKQSRGTFHCVHVAREAELLVVIVNEGNLGFIDELKRLELSVEHR